MHCSIVMLIVPYPEYSKAVGDTVKQATSTASKEANKNVARDSDADLSTRATAAKDAIGNKVDEQTNAASSELNKQKAKH